MDQKWILMMAELSLTLSKLSKMTNLSQYTEMEANLEVSAMLTT